MYISMILCVLLFVSISYKHYVVFYPIILYRIILYYIGVYLYCIGLDWIVLNCIVVYHIIAYYSSDTDHNIYYIINVL